MTLLDILTDNQKEQLYLDWKKRWIPLKDYAEHHKITPLLAELIIREGKEVADRKS